jgi:hypothetical protein
VFGCKGGDGGVFGGFCATDADPGGDERDRE